MTHLFFSENSNSEISIEEGKTVLGLRITESGSESFIAFDKKELHDFIGLLLHIQSKMRK